MDSEPLCSKEKKTFAAAGIEPTYSGVWGQRSTSYTTADCNQVVKLFFKEMFGELFFNFVGLANLNGSIKIVSEIWIGQVM